MSKKRDKGRLRKATPLPRTQRRAAASIRPRGDPKNDASSGEADSLPDRALGFPVVGIGAMPGDSVDAAPGETFSRVLVLLKSKFHVDLASYKLTTIRRRIER